MLPHILIYTDRLPANSNGCANGPVVRIRPSKKGDKGLLEHEALHTHQWWTGGLLIHSLRYKWSKAYRQDCEVACYREQLGYPHPRYTTDELREMYATWLSDPSETTGYGLTLTKEDALKLLS